MIVGNAFHRDAEVEFAVHDIDRFANLHIRDVAHVNHCRIHADASKNWAELPADKNKPFVVFATEVTVTVTDGDGCDACELLGRPVATVADRFAGLHVVHVADGRFDFHDRFDRPRRRACTHAVVTVKRKARANHVEMAFGVSERACRTRTMADGRAESVGVEHIDESRKTLDLYFCFRVAGHIGGREMREHAFELEMLEGERCADVIEIFGVKTITVHACINGEMRSASRSRFSKELVEGDCRAEIRDRCGQLEFDKVGKVRWRAWAKYKYGQVHAVLSKNHSFADVGDSQIVCTAEFGGERAGEASVTVGVRFDG